MSEETQHKTLTKLRKLVEGCCKTYHYDMNRYPEKGETENLRLNVDYFINKVEATGVAIKEQTDE